MIAFNPSIILILLALASITFAEPAQSVDVPAGWVGIRDAAINIDAQKTKILFGVRSINACADAANADGRNVAIYIAADQKCMFPPEKKRKQYRLRAVYGTDEQLGLKFSKGYVMDNFKDYFQSKWEREAIFKALRTGGLKCDLVVEWKPLFMGRSEFACASFIKQKGTVLMLRRN